MTKAKFYAEDLNMDLKNLKLEDLGSAKKITVTKDTTTIIDGMGEKTLIDARIKEIKKQIEVASSDYDKKKLSERLGKLTNGVAVVKVGATTETELKHKKLKIEDALNATKAAISEGIIIGGGATLISLYNELKPVLSSDIVDVQRGINVVLDSLLVPTYTIAENAGFDGDEIVKKQKEAKGNTGFDALKGVWVDMFKAGIVDPTKVTRSAILNAASISSMFITTEAAVGEIKEAKPQMPSGEMY